MCRTGLRSKYDQEFNVASNIKGISDTFFYYPLQLGWLVHKADPKRTMCWGLRPQFEGRRGVMRDHAPLSLGILSGKVDSFFHLY